MAAPGFGTSPFILPNSFDKPGDALQETLRRGDIERRFQYEREYRAARQKEEDDWKKLQLIQELTNLDKYQTGEQAADAIGYQRAQDLFQKYTAAAHSMTPAELQYKISQDIGKTTLGMQTMKDELMKSDAQIKQIKQLYPSIDAASLMKEHRREILGRRVKGNDFVNPQIVEPSNFKLDDPDFLSYFVRDSKGLTNSIRNPKYAEDVTVAMGSPSSYSTGKVKLPFYAATNYDRNEDIKNMFLKKGIQPSTKLRSSTEKLRGSDVDVLDEEPFGVLDEEARLELAREARQKFNDYDKMTNEEKRTARRNVAVDFAKTNLPNFDFGTATKPPHFSVSTGGSGNDAANLNNIYERIKQKGFQRVKDYKEGSFFNNSLEKQDLDGDELEVVMKATQDKNLTPDDIKIIVEDDGRIGIYNKGDGKRLVYLNQTGSNLPKQANVAGKKASVELGNKPYKPGTVDKPTTPKKDPLGLFH